MLLVLENNLQSAKTKIIAETQKSSSTGSMMLEEGKEAVKQHMRYINIREFAEMEASLKNEGYGEEFDRIKAIIKEIAA